MNIFNINFLLLDYVILAIVLIIIIFSFWKGFINSILGLLTWVGSIFITIYTYELIAGYIDSWLLNFNILSDLEQFVSIFSIILSIPIIFLLSLFILKKIRKVLSSDLDKQIFGLIIDKLFGALYGSIFSYVIFSTIIYITYNNNLNILQNLNIFLIDNSNILKQISEYNENLLSIYIVNDD